MFNKRLCPHRGIGEENTLTSIYAGIQRRPFMVEFDVQLHDHKLHLGHPPVLNTESTLQDALNLFVHKPVIPKIDLKLNAKTFYSAIASLVDELDDWSPNISLVSIDGDLDAKGFMLAENQILKLTDNKTLLNVDLCKYKNKTSKEIDRHIQGLTRHPFSISPNLDDDIDYAIDFAIKHKIGHVHFWAKHDKKYGLNFLYSLMERVLDSGLEVYFDISDLNIIDWNRETLPQPVKVGL
jgi:hypothetical protein